jgi:hypothetical protein
MPDDLSRNALDPPAQADPSKPWLIEWDEPSALFDETERAVRLACEDIAWRAAQIAARGCAEDRREYRHIVEALSDICDDLGIDPPHFPRVRP